MGEGIRIFDEAVEKLLEPERLRHLLVLYLIGEKPSNVMTLWNTYKTELSKDFTDDNENRALYAIEHLLQAEGGSCEYFGLPTLQPIAKNNDDEEITARKIKEFAEKGSELVKQLNDEQRNIYDAVMRTITTSDATENDTMCKLFFIDGPGGTGKTFLYNAIYNMLRSKNKTVACVAWTGIAATLLPCGTTAHKMFGIPIEMNNESTISTTPSMSKKIKSIDVIIWDECSMISKTALEWTDSLLKNIMKNSLPFGGKTVLLGGDFRQLLPIVKGCNGKQIIKETIKYSKLWNKFEKFSLTTNIRAEEVPFSKWLLSVGNGKIDLLKPEKEAMSTDLVTELYPRGITSNELINRAILARLNDEVNQLNTKILPRLEGDLIVSKSIDYATLPEHDPADTTRNKESTPHSIKQLNQLELEGLPPHNLQLKIGAIVMILRHLSASEGICNGTRLIVRAIHSNILIAEHLTGERRGERVAIPKIKLHVKFENDRFILHRRQFPVRLAFAMTINKSQGQSFDFVGLYIRPWIFNHGQLYVALSRCKSKKGIKIETKKDIHNIVYKEILDEPLRGTLTQNASDCE